MKTSRALLQEARLRVTNQRMAVLDILTSSKQPLSIDGIMKRVGEHMNITTIYRILDALVAAGIVYQTDFHDGKAYFEFQDHHHHHVTCRSCGRREDTTVCIDRALSSIEEQSKLFPIVQSHTLEFFGFCKKCVQ